MSGLPLHRASQMSDFGLHLHRISSPDGRHGPVTYAHRDDYYIFGLIERGEGHGIIDFNELHLAEGDAFVIQPGQVHRFVRSDNADGWLLLADTNLVEAAEKCVFDNFALFDSKFRVDCRRRTELSQLASLLSGRLDGIADAQAMAVAWRLAAAFIGILAEAVQDVVRQPGRNRRQVDIVLSFRRLLAERIALSRRPSYYASLLNISTVYLNEVVRAVTGMSTSDYIKNEAVLLAKRMLVHTDLSVKEIAGRLGIDDYAYFTRLFTRTAGVSPTAFRLRYLG